MKNLQRVHCFLLSGALAAFIAIALSATLPERLSAQDTGDITIVAFGDSLTVGVGATENNGYVDILERRTGLDIVNAGVSGDTTASALARVDNVIANDPDIVIVFLGGNDILQLIPLADTINNLRQIITQLQEGGASVILVGAHGETFSNVRDAQFESLADELNARYVPDALEDIIGNPDLLSDPIHPNNAGYLLIADRMWPVLQDTLNDEFPGQPLSVTCEPNPQEVFIRDQVRWMAFAWGGEQPGSYRFTWSGDEGLSGTGQTRSITYDDPGTRSASVEARSGNEIAEADCAPDVVVITPPLAGRCEVDVDIRPESTVDNEVNELFITWSAFGGGGTGEYQFSWTGTNGLQSTESQVEQQYTSAGLKEATVTITSGGESIELPCSADVPASSLVMATSSRPLQGSCTISPRNYAVDDEITWRANISGGTRPYTFSWDGDGNLEGNTSVVRESYGTPGTKLGTVTVDSATSTIDTAPLELQCAIHIVEAPVTTGSGCFIATALFGSELEPNVALLRRFRDEKLMDSELGQAFVDFYYEHSPAIADMIRNNEPAKAVVREFLRPVIFAVDLVQE